MIGTQIGDLKLVRLLAEGGMGAVYLAEHLLLNDFQAVKILNPALAQNGDLVTRFLNEGRATVKLRHPNLVAVHDVGRLPGDGAWYMVMEYLEGGTLARFMASQGGPLSMYLILHIMGPVIDCMQWMHDHGVIHRDMKPENLFLIQRQGDPHFPKVLDLGVAKVSDAIAQGPGTRAGSVMGTLTYMAPEQLRGEKVSALVDIFALGMIIYEMSTGGWFPWQRGNESRQAYCNLPPIELYHRHCTEPPVDPRERYRGISDSWAAAVMSAIDPDPRKRPKSDRDLAILLGHAVPSDGVHDNGIEIVRRRAPDLLGEQIAPLRGPAGAAPSCPPPASPFSPASPAAPAPGGKLRYKLGAKLGNGGMAEVFDGRLLGAEGFERRVAIKRVMPGLSDVSAFVSMFVAEAQIVSRLNHSNVVMVFDFDRDDEGRLCLVMEYVHGKDLARLLAAGPLPRSLIIYIVVELLRGLGYAHAPEPDRDGIVHRDVSPHNVLLSYEGAVKVTDFGIAKARDASGNAESYTVRGKPSYMSPEQCNAGVLDARSDLFSVGTMLWEMLTHQPLFRGTPKEIIAHVLFMEIPRPSVVNPEVPPDLEAITLKLMARSPSERYASAEEAIADLLRCDDAPRDGRGDLVQMLAERFPAEALRTRINASVVPSRRRAPSPDASNATSRETVAEHAARAAKPVSPPGASTLRHNRRRLAAMFIGTAVVGAVMVMLIARGATREPLAKPPDRGVLAPGSAATIARITAPDAGVAVATAPSTSRPAPAVETPAHINLTVRGPGAQGPGSAQPAELPTLQAASSLPAAAPGRSGPLNTAPAAIGSQPRAVVAAGSAGDAGSAARPGSATPARRGLGQLTVSVTPWANVYLNGQPAGETPFVGQLPAGRYRVRIENKDLHKEDEVIVTVSSEVPATIKRAW